ncbi:hypothetical protein SLEP1_g44768 [Rubroshorea leprosula]|uniref:Uncharacterized protein n=1 Tax=Rubroshorea leprosula TaxID=152421 RepID=A0AAV5LHM3_9ROSI|nr:hypothetical protein SLEP1_g44768 [Rubroshorea leprosula]
MATSMLSFRIFERLSWFRSSGVCLLDLELHFPFTVTSCVATLFHANNEEEPSYREDPSLDDAKGDALIGVMLPHLNGFNTVVVGGAPKLDTSGKCVVGKGGPRDVAGVGDKVVIGGDDVDIDKGARADCRDDGFGFEVSEH